MTHSNHGFHMFFPSSGHAQAIVGSWRRQSIKKPVNRVKPVRQGQGG
jgi:hypothetical protein